MRNLLIVLIFLSTAANAQKRRSAPMKRHFIVFYDIKDCAGRGHMDMHTSSGFPNAYKTYKILRDSSGYQDVIITGILELSALDYRYWTTKFKEDSAIVLPGRGRTEATISSQ